MTANAERQLGSAAPFPELAFESLRLQCDPDTIPVRSTTELEPLEAVLGQDTAVEALRFGLAIDAPGQNIFVRGLTGTGRMTLIHKLLDGTDQTAAPLFDRCYVHNFKSPDRPRLISLPAGQGHVFKQRVDELADFIRDDLDTALTTGAMQARRAALEQHTQSRIDQLVKPLENEAREAGLALVAVQAGPLTQAMLFPLHDNEPAPPEKWEELCRTEQITPADAARVNRILEIYQKRLQEALQQVNLLRREHNRAAKQLLESSIHAVLTQFTTTIENEFSDESTALFLSELINDVAVVWNHAAEERVSSIRQYRVNVVLAHAADAPRPIVLENTPSLMNLLGSIDRSFDRTGADRSDHLLIRAGSLLRADRGYLVLEARDVLAEPGAWRMLLRTLRTGRLEIVPPEMTMPWMGRAIKPEQIDVKVKVILLGDAETYHMLDAYDPDFPYMFRVLADFDSAVPRTPDYVERYCRALARIIRDEHLHPFDNHALASLIEYAARIASRQDRLTTRFGRLADIAREASFIADRRSQDVVTGADVDQAIVSAKRRIGLPSRHFRELLADGTIQIDTTGTVVGQVNGLAVMQAGPLTNGFPARITATIGPGASGPINIEREAQMSGAIHTKGFYILGGLLRYLLRTLHPLTFSASVAFEQSYGGIDGDSASGAEICCLLSALTDIPLRQDVAMTGAIDQTGNVLAVGAVNEKIEGFFDTCRDTQLTGRQGVIIPRANARDLMLRPDVVKACAEDRFRVYAVDTIHDALEILTGVTAGIPDERGTYPPDTLLGVAVEKAFEYWLRVSPQVIMDAQANDAPEDEAAGVPPPTRKKKKKKLKKKKAGARTKTAPGPRTRTHR